MTYCKHCSRGLCAYQIAIVLTVASGAFGLVCGALAHMPNEGLAFGLLHAVVPVFAILDEVTP